MASRELRYVITGDARDFNRATRSVNRDLGEMETRSKRSFSAIKVGAIAAGAAVTGGLAKGLFASVQAAKDAEAAQARMTAQLKASGISFRAHGKEIDSVIQKTSRLSALDDEDLQDSFTNIVRATGNVNQSLKLTGLAADFARAKHVDVAKAGDLVGKVAAGNTGILSRYGITLQKGATSAQALAALQQKFGGQAEAYGKTTQGALDRMNVAFENIGESVGATFGPAIAKAGNAVARFLDQIRSGEGAGGKFADVMRSIGGAFSVAGGVIGKVASAIKSAIGPTFAFVRRVLDRNREDLKTAGEAFRNLGRAGAYVFNEVLLPVIQAFLRRIVPVLEGVKDTLSGLLRFISAVFAGRWGKAWDALKDTVVGALRTVVRAVKGIADVLFTAVKAVGRQIIRGIVAGLSGLAGAVKNAIVSGVKKGVSGIGNLIKDAIPKINLPKINLPFGDGVGIPSTSTPGLGGSGGLRGADPDLQPFANIGSRFGLSVSSGLRPGSITSSGNTSFHSSGDAIDEAGSPAGMLQYFRFLKRNFGSRLRELIYTPGGVGIKDGRPYRYTGAVAADHYDHVHVAYTGPFGDGPGRKPRTGDGIGDIKKLWVRAGGNPSRANLAAAVAMAESGGNPRAVNSQNSDGSIDRGLWQINSIHGALSTLDRLANAKAAVRISGNGSNWSPWVAYKTGAYRRFLTSGPAPSPSKSKRAPSTAAAPKPSGPNLGIQSVRTFGAQQMANLDLLEAGAVSSGDVGAQQQVLFARAALKQSQINAIDNELKGRVSAKRRLALTRKKATLLGDLSGLRDSAAGLGPSTDTGADAGGDFSQEMLDAIQANTEALQARAEQEASLAAELKRTNDTRLALGSAQETQITRWVVEQVSRTLGQTVGLAGQTPAFPGGGMRW